MRITLGLIVAILTLVACQQVREQGTGRSGRTFDANGGVSLSAWLDHTQPVHEYQAFSAPVGSEIRRAALWVPQPASNPELVVITRDYENRIEGQADRQNVHEVELPGTGKQAEIEGLPLGLVVSPDRRTVCVATLGQSGIGSFSQEQVTLELWRGQEPPKRISLEDQALPFTFLGNEAVQLRAVTSFQLEGGLLAPSYARDESCYVVRLPELQVNKTDAMYFLSQGSTLAATMDQSFDPASPATATVSIAVVPWPRGGRPQYSEYTFPLHVSYSPFAWQPQLDWIDEQLLGALVFMPELVEEGRRDNFHGLFKLVTLDRGGTVNLIEDHLSGDLPFHASGGMLFYTRRTAVNDSQLWEVWASSPDGIYKRLVWSSSDPVYISLEDASAGHALLLQVQTLEVRGGTVALESKLLALSLEPIGDAEPAAERDDTTVQTAPPGSMPPPIAAPGDG